jgi:FkbM family methyltransferase
MRHRIKSALLALFQQSLSISDQQKTDEALAEESIQGPFSVNKSLNVNGKTFRFRGDAYLARMKLGFEPGLTHLFNTIANSVPPGSCLDVGANIGITAHLLSGLYTHVYCFEASPRTYQILKENLLRNNIKNVTTFPFGLGKESKTFTLTAANNDASGGFLSDDLSADLDGHTKETVEISKGDDLLESIQEINITPIRFIKLDIEGHELEALNGLKKILENHKPVVVLEMNHWCLNAFKRLSIPEFLETLDTYFPAILAFDDPKHELIDISAGRDSSRYHVMHEHIVHNRFPTLISSSDIETINKIKANLSGQEART